MTKLEKMIEELCPNGVEYVKLSDVVSYEQPSKYIVKSTDYNDEFNTPVLTAGQTFILGYTNETDGIYQATKENPVIIFDDFTGAFKWVDFSFKVKSSAMKILKVECNETTLRYIYHIMGYLNFSSDEHKRLWISIYSQFEIPLPPIEVQREIVMILDKYFKSVAELQKALEQEFTLRKKQYEYYRDKLLNFDVRGGGTTDCKWKTLGEIFNIRNGYTPSKSNAEYWENGTVPWFRMEDIRENGHILTDSIQKVSLKAVKGELFPADSIIVATSATIGEHALIKCKSLANQRFTYIVLKDEYKDKFNIKFIYYYCYKLDEYCFNCLNQSNFASVDMSKFRNFKFPVISIGIQERIASILDRFDKLCNDITEGLPAEIEARQKQYEYYRDKLLAFKMKE